LSNFYFLFGPFISLARLCVGERQTATALAIRRLQRHGSSKLPHQQHSVKGDNVYVVLCSVEVEVGCLSGMKLYQSLNE
jgi:hypothetical protein